MSLQRQRRSWNVNESDDLQSEFNDKFITATLSLRNINPLTPTVSIWAQL